MNVLRIHKALVSGRFTVIISILLVLVMRLLTESAWNNYIFWLVLVIQVGIALALLQFNHNFTIIRNKTMLPAVFYLLLTGTNPAFYYDITGTLAALSVLLCLQFLFNSYQDPDSQRNAFNISLILTFCSLLWEPLLFFFPFIWYGFYKFRCFNYKTFLATIIGILTVYLFVFAWNIYNNDIRSFPDFLPEKKEFLLSDSLNFTLADWVISGYILVLFFVSGFKLYFFGISEKVRTSTFLRYLYIMAIGVFVMQVLQSDKKAIWTLILYIPVSLILSHYFTLSGKKLQAWLLLFSFIFFFGMYIWQLMG